MNRTTAKRLFDPHRPLYCRRELTEGGHTFGIGDEFPWEQLGLRPEHVLPLFRHRHVGHDRLVDEEKPDGVAPEAEALTDESGNRLDGPTIEEWVGAGYLPEHYPPRGWAIKPSDGLLAWNARQAGGEVLVVLPWDEAAVQKRRTENEEYAARQARAELSKLVSRSIGIVTIHIEPTLQRLRRQKHRRPMRAVLGLLDQQ